VSEDGGEFDLIKLMTDLLSFRRHGGGKEECLSSSSRLRMNYDAF
jgi:hypothetical protein